jgi:two-component system, cell cycle sensor histidine kinase and response regulator CckA
MGPFRALLVTDDDDLAYEFAQSLLAHIGDESVVDATRAYNADEAIAVVRKKPQHMVLVDSSLARSTAADASATLIRELRDNHKHPVVRLAANGETPPRNIVLGATDVPVLYRPFSASDLTNVVGLITQQQLLYGERDFASTVLSHMSQGVGITSKDGYFEYINTAYGNLLGRQPADIIGTPVESITLPEDRADQATQQALRRTGITSTYRTRLLRGDGSVLPVAITAVPRRKRGEYDGAIAFLTDLTERKRLEDLLEEERNFAAHVVSRMAQGISVTNADGCFEFVNRAYAEFLGWRPEQLVGQHASVVTAPEHRGMLGEQRALREAGKTSTYDSRLVRIDGREVIVSITASPRATTDGHFAGSIAVITDVTERRLTERAIQDSEARFRSLVEFSPIAKIVYREDKIFYVNPAAVGLLAAKSADDLCQRRPTDLVHPDWRASGNARAQQLLDGVASVPLRAIQMVRLDGVVIDVDVQSIAIPYDGVRAICSTLIDVTERHEAAVALAKSKRQAELLAQLGKRLGEASNTEVAAMLILDTAQQLLGWDAAWLHLWGERQERLIDTVSMDTINGEITRVAPNPGALIAPTPTGLKVMREGAQMILRQSVGDMPTPTYMFGSDRVSMSLMFVPLRHADGLVGVMSIQSYAKNAYAKADLELLHALADHAAGALGRIHAAQALTVSEARFHHVIGATEDGVWDWQIGKDHVYFSPQWARLLGYEAHELVPNTSTFFATIHPDDVAMVTETLNDHLAGKTAIKFSQVRLRTKQGEYRWFADRGKVVEWGEDGKPARMVGTITDITEQKRAQDAVEESEKRYRQLIDWLPDPIFIHQDAVIRLVNPALVNLIGAPDAASLIGRTALDLVHPDSRASAEARVAEYAGKEVAPPTEMKCRRDDGAAVDIEIQSRVVEFAGAPAIYVVMRDLTERKRAERQRDLLEAQLRESQKMEAIGTLAGGIAHDFNNILAVILGNLSLARQDVANKPSQALESLDEIEKAAQRARDLVQQILSFSRRQATQMKWLSLQPVVEESVRFLRVTLPLRMSIETQFGDHLPLVSADATQIQQVVLNLVNNAMQAMGQGCGRIVVKLAQVVVGSEQVQAVPQLESLAGANNGRTVCLSVSDNGPGMDETTLGRIFEPFFTTKPVDEGTGLGLSVVHGIAASHGSVVVVESKIGVGTTFSLYFPAPLEANSDLVRSEMASASSSSIPTKPAPEQEPSSALDEAAPRATVLYLDDDEALVFVMGRLLARQGVRMLGFGVQEDALAAVANPETKIDLVVTDFNMPGINGIETLYEIRRLRAQLPVAICSGFIDDRLRSAAAEAAAVALLYKANRAESISEAIATLATSIAEGSRER